MVKRETGKSRKNLLVTATLGLLPVLVVGGYVLVVESGITFGTQKMTAVDRWRDGEVKILAREWLEGEDSFTRFCYLDPEGKDWGCGIERNGKPWEGSFVEWYWYGRKTPDPEEAYGIPRSIQPYRNGQPHGEWRAFYETGAVASKIMFREGKRVAWEVYNPAGRKINEGRIDDHAQPEK